MIEPTSFKKKNSRLFGVCCALALIAGCAKLEKEKLPQVTTAGSHAVMVGQTLALTASTANGSDSAYAWASSAPTIATVDHATGVVTGVAVGEAAITATGNLTAAVGTHAIVVIAPPVMATDAGVPVDLTKTIPYMDKWMTSAHADSTAEAFNHWNKEGTVPVECARCHSAEGFADYVGGDGSQPFQVDRPAPAKSVIACRACHNAAADALSQVTFPSGFTAKNLGGEARCMTCHQGRASGRDVDLAIINAGAPADDATNPMLRFTNVHYYPAAATLFAGRAGGGYQYSGKVYDARFRHVPGYDTCIGCHDPHTARPKFNECVACHNEAKDVAGAHTIRMMSSQGNDYDGDGNVTEGVYDELTGLIDKLRATMSAYGKERNTPICYDTKTYPYWFGDTDGDGTCSAAEAVATNGFAKWTPRLLRAAYNYQLASKDPGAFAHNSKYVIELLFDSISDVNSALVAKTDMSRAVRTDRGHFNGTGEPARHWDQNDTVDAGCSKCHSGSTGFRFYQTFGVGEAVIETANGLDCATCHTNFGTKFDVLPVAQTTFPSGAVVKQMGNDNLCSTCHSGRESKVSIDNAIAAKTYKFINIHYLAAAATKLGNTAHGGYEYEGKTYAGPLQHTGGTQCTSCHDPRATQHSFEIVDGWETTCRTCHADANGNPQAIRQVHKLDYDGDGNTTESLKLEIEGMAAKALLAMKVLAPDICYGAGAYPYFFKDTDKDGKPECSPAEAVAANGFKAWTPALMKASFNYQLARTEPGAWAHNFEYIGQLLYDAAADASGAVPTMTRP